MNRMILGFAPALVCAALASAPAARAASAHEIIETIAHHAPDTPHGEGYLSLADKEAAIALQHAGFAAGDPTDRDSITLHMSHVHHALEALEGAAGPGLGFGLVNALERLASALQALAAADDASDAVRLHAGHMQASLAGAWGRLDGLFRAHDTAADPDTPLADAATAAREVADILGRIVNGYDADADGTIGWRKSEGGLAQMRRHLGFMLAAEGLD